jgi:hypothetical protein
MYFHLAYSGSFNRSAASAPLACPDGGVPQIVMGPNVSHGCEGTQLPQSTPGGVPILSGGFLELLQAPIVSTSDGVLPSVGDGLGDCMTAPGQGGLNVQAAATGEWDVYRVLLGLCSPQCERTIYMSMHG